MTIVNFEYLGYEIEAILVEEDGEAYCESYIARCLTTGEIFEYIPKLDAMIAKRAVDEV